MDLKPCPFCGGEAGVLQIGNEATRKRGFEIKCLTWGCATTKRAMVIYQPIERAREFVIKAWNRRAPTPREQELREALEELANEVFGREVGSEPDVYADYDRLCELERKARAALTNGGAKSRKLNADRRWFLKRWDFGGWSPNILTAKKWKQCANWCVMAGFLEHDELMYRITDAGRYALTNGGAS